MPSRPPIVLSVGGSLVVPKTGIDTVFLKAFREVIAKGVAAGQRFVIVVGGGQTARMYQKAANDVTNLTDEDTDWIGIHATRLNAHLLRTVFRDIAHPRVIKNPTGACVWNAPVLIAAGWKPGWSTDYIAVRLAKKCGSTRIINLTNIDAVYDKDPSKYKDAKAYTDLSWTDFRKIVGSVWEPGANAPFDPIASQLAQRSGMEVVIAQGTDMKNVRAIIDGGRFRGTKIVG